MTGIQNTKIVFLDCDGVISPFVGGKLFSPIHMKRLKKILNESGAKLVLSSSWRTTEFGRSEVNRQLTVHGMPHCIDSTPDIPNKSRAVEILTWLNNNKEKYNIVNFVALDDIHLAATAPDKAFFSKHAVCTDSNTGMNDKDVELALTLLSDDNNFA